MSLALAPVYLPPAWTEMAGEGGMSDCLAEERRVCRASLMLQVQGSYRGGFPYVAARHGSDHGWDGVVDSASLTGCSLWTCAHHNCLAAIRNTGLDYYCCIYRLRRPLYCGRRRSKLICIIFFSSDKEQSLSFLQKKKKQSCISFCERSNQRASSSRHACMHDLASSTTSVWWYACLMYHERDRKSTRLNSSHITRSRMPSSA